MKAGGNAIVEMFEKNLGENSEYSEEYADFICKLYESYNLSDTLQNALRKELLDAFSEKEEGNGIFTNGEYSIKSGLEFFCKMLCYEEELTYQQQFIIFSDSLAFFTTFMASEIPDFYIPYYFKWNFNVLMKIAEEFEIEIPAVPLKSDYKGRLEYYGDICEALYDFRCKHNLSPYELCAFLYDFAPKYIGGIDSYIVKELPEPESAFFIGANRSDAFLSEDENTITPWQCNPNAKVGDIAVMYLKTPISSVTSQWRCVSDGFTDPFFYYYRCVYIAKPLKINWISQTVLKNDEILKELSIVRKNMQGINGIELLPSQYNHLMDIAKSDVPRLKYSVTKAGVELMSENDVKGKLIRPLIGKLGYTQNDYASELHMEIGNHNNMIIPDFVLLPDETKGKQSAFVIIEAKYYIKSNTEFENVLIQARSYARQCIAKYSAIIDRNKLWIYTRDDDYTTPVLNTTWDELSDSDTFIVLKKLIGKKK